MQVSYYKCPKESCYPQRKKEWASSEGRALRAAQGDKMTVEQSNDWQAGATKRLSPWPGIQHACQKCYSSAKVQHYMHGTSLKQPLHRDWDPRVGKPLQKEKGTCCFLSIYDVLFRELLQDLAFMQPTDFIPISEVLEKS